MKQHDRLLGTLDAVIDGLRRRRALLERMAGSLIAGDMAALDLDGPGADGSVLPDTASGEDTGPDTTALDMDGGQTGCQTDADCVALGADKCSQGSCIFAESGDAGTTETVSIAGSEPETSSNAGATSDGEETPSLAGAGGAGGSTYGASVTAGLQYQ